MGGDVGMYKLFSCYLNEDYMLALPENAAQLLTDEVFLKETAWLFEEGISGYKINQVKGKEGYWCMTVQYWQDDGTYSEEEFYMKKVVLVDSFGVHREES